MQTTCIVKEIEMEHEMISLYPLLTQLNASLTREKYETMIAEMIPKGYKMAGVFEGEKCIGLSGYWIATKLYSGKYVELDNVIIDVDHRGRGIGKLLCDHILNAAVREGCVMAMLDAYLENEKAHAFYEREGFFKRGYHFLKHLKPVS